MDSIGTLLVLSLIGLPLFASILAALPGSWWKESERYRIVAGGLIAIWPVIGLLLKDLSELQSVTQRVFLGVWWTGDSPIELALRIDPARLLLIAATVLSSLIATVIVGFQQDSAASKRIAAVSGITTSLQAFIILVDHPLLAWMGWRTAGIVVQRIRPQKDNGRNSRVAALHLSDFAGAASILFLVSRYSLAEVVIPESWMGSLKNPVDHVSAFDAMFESTRPIPLLVALLCLGVSTFRRVSSIAFRADSSSTVVTDGPIRSLELALTLPASFWLLFTWREVVAGFPLFHSWIEMTVPLLFLLVALRTACQQDSAKIGAGCAVALTLLWYLTLSGTSSGSAVNCLKLLLAITVAGPLLPLAAIARVRTTLAAISLVLLAAAMTCGSAFDLATDPVSISSDGDSKVSELTDDPNDPRPVAATPEFLVPAVLAFGAAFLGVGVARIRRMNRANRRPNLNGMDRLVWLYGLTPLGVGMTAEWIGIPLTRYIPTELQFLFSVPTNSLFAAATLVLAFLVGLFGGTLMQNPTGAVKPTWRTSLIDMACQGFFLGATLESLGRFLLQSFQRVFPAVEERVTQLAALLFGPVLGKAAQIWHESLPATETSFLVLTAVFSSAVFALAFLLV